MYLSVWLSIDINVTPNKRISVRVNFGEMTSAKNIFNRVAKYWQILYACIYLCRILLVEATKIANH